MLLLRRCTPCKPPLARQFLASPLRHKYRRASPVFQQAKIEDGTATRTLQRVSYFLALGQPGTAIGYFNKRMTNSDTKIPERAFIYEAVLDLLLRERHFDEVEKVRTRMENERLQLSPAVRAKLFAARFANGSVTVEVFLNSLQQLFGDTNTNFGEWHFHDFLSQVSRMEGSIENCEKVLDLYLKSKGSDYRLDPLLVTFMVELHLKAGSKSNAERWIDHHSSRPRSSEPNPKLLYPYTAFISCLADSIPPTTDPTPIYAPILDRITADGLNPDTVLVNTLITIELRHGRPHLALEFFTALRETITHDVYPDAATFAQLFTAAGRAAQDARRRGADPHFGIPPRMLFRDMLTLHGFQSSGQLSTRSPVLSTSSLGQALWQFVAAYDYAAACVALRVYVTQRVPVEEQAVIGSVTSALLERCRREIRLSRNDTSGTDSTPWVATFQNLRTLAPWRLKGEPARDTERRMVDAAKRDLLLNAMSVAARKPSPGTDSSTPGPDEMQFRLRVRRLRLVDAMLTRALAASFVDERRSLPPAELRKLAEQAIAEATVEMVPDGGAPGSSDLDVAEGKADASNSYNFNNAVDSMMHSSLESTDDKNNQNKAE